MGDSHGLQPAEVCRGLPHSLQEQPESFKNEVLSGITVAVMQVPESVAFSFVAGVPPLVGLYSTFFWGSLRP